MAAQDKLPEVRGPRAGEAASLWNFSSAPGWSDKELHALRLCLTVHGIGAWQAILRTGLLPGKTVQQVSSATQRLLGQQALAAYTGLQVDIDAVAADNTARTGVTRKGGLIIHDGPPATPSVKAAWRVSSNERYGLPAEAIAKAQLELQLLQLEAAGSEAPQLDGTAAALAQPATSLEITCNSRDTTPEPDLADGDYAPGLAAAHDSSVQGVADAGITLLSSDIDGLAQPELVHLVGGLRAHLSSLVTTLHDHLAGRGVRPSAATLEAGAAQGLDPAAGRPASDTGGPARPLQQPGAFSTALGAALAALNWEGVAVGAGPLQAAACRAVQVGGHGFGAAGPVLPLGKHALEEGNGYQIDQENSGTQGQLATGALVSSAMRGGPCAAAQGRSEQANQAAMLAAAAAPLDVSRFRGSKRGRRPGRAGSSKRKRKRHSDSEDECEECEREGSVAADTGPAAEAGGGSRQRGSSMRKVHVAAAVMEADLSMLEGMGWGRTEAREALKECGGVLEAAVEWLCTFGGA